MARRFLYAITVALVGSVSVTHAEDAAKVDFEKDIAPILRQNCIDCHGPELQMADLRLDQRRFALGDDADPDLIRPGKSSESLFIKRLTDPKLGLIMPPTFPFFPGEKAGLNDATLKVLKDWIDQGAPWPEGAQLASEAASGAETAEAKALFAAIRTSERKHVANLLEKNRQLASARDKYGDTPLMQAATYGDAPLLKLLIDAGADVNAANPEGATALMRAAGDYDKVKLLLDHGASADARSKLGRTPLLIAAAIPGNLKTVWLLLALGGQINEQDQAGDNCLTSAAKRGDTEMVKALLEAGAEPSVASAFGRSPLMWAAEEGNVDTLACLLQRDAAKAQPGLDFALSSATMRGPAAAVRMLLEHGANPNTPSPIAGYTPLMWAAYSENVSVETAKLLLERGADVGAKGANGETASSLAKKRGNSAVANLLGADAQTPAKTEPAAVGKVEPEQIKAAAEKGLALLQSCGPTFFARSGCVACHQQSVTSLAVAEARKRGMKLDEPTAREQVKITALTAKPLRERMLQRSEHPSASAPGAGYVALGLAAEGYAADEYTDPMILAMADRQHLDGSWTTFGHRPPLEYSRIGATALGLRALQLYGPPSMANKYAQKIERARKWLLAAEPATHSDHVFRMLGLWWGRAAHEPIAAEVKILLQAQNSDGGWSQFPTLASDAYATGLALFALGASGQVSASDPAYERGVAYLVRTQLPDGSWHVRTRSFPFQAYFESGFPHGPDQWISATATGFATVALLQALPEVQQ